LTELEISEHEHLDSFEESYPKIKTMGDLEWKNRVYVDTFNGPLFFGETRIFNQVIENLPKIDTLVLYFKHVPLIDLTGVFALEHVIDRLEGKDIRVVFVGLTEELSEKLTKFNVIHKMPDQNIFETLVLASEDIVAKHEIKK